MTDKAKLALEAFCKTVEQTGGVVNIGTGYLPVVDREWYDLGDAYLLACDALGRKPVVEEEREIE